MISTPKRVLVIQIRRLGDVLISTPLAADLRRQFPDAQIDFMVGRAAAPLLENNPDISRVLLFDASRMFAMLRGVRQKRYDWIVDVQAHPRTAILTMLSGVKIRAGWNARFWGIAYNHRLPRPSSPEYSGRSRQKLLEQLGVRTGSPLPRAYLTDAERAQGRDAAAKLRVPENQTVVGIAIGAADPRRDWSAEGFASVAEELERGGVTVIVFRFPGDEERIREFRSQTDAGLLAEWNGDRNFLALLERCDAFVSPNSGPSHMATAVGVPRVTLYDSASAPVWSPGLETTIALSNPRQPCLGCGTRECPLKRECVRGIRADEVVAAVRSLMEAFPQRSEKA
jgi:heptosyltransferase-3